MKEIAMRDAFLDELYQIAKEDHRIILISADFGAPSLDKFRKDLSDQFVNVGIAEQNMVDIAAGLALAGKIVFCYAIAPFITMRCYEQIRVDLCCMNLPVTLIGVGAGYGYDDSGPTHHTLEDMAVMRALPNMTILNASDSVMAGAFADIAYKSPGPKYVRLDRTKHCFDWGDHDFRTGIAEIIHGNDLKIIATGYMVSQALAVHSELQRTKVHPGIYDLYRIKPLNKELLWQVIDKAKAIITLEENFIHGGIGSIVAESMADTRKQVPLKRLGIPDMYSFKYGGRKKLHEDCSLDVDSIAESILKWVKEIKW